MKAYVSSRTRDSEKEKAQEVGALLEGKGFVVEYDWTQNMIEGEFEDHPEESARAAMNMIQATFEADLFVLLWDPSMYGAHNEMGSAMAASVVQSEQRMIYIIKPPGERPCIFEWLPAVRVVATKEEMLADLDSREEELKYDRFMREFVDFLRRGIDVNSNEPPPGFSQEEWDAWRRKRDSMINRGNPAERSEGDHFIG